jgi:hypothetical protein
LIITLTALGAGAYTALQDHELAGSILGVGGIGSIVTSFLAGRAKQGYASAPQQQATPKESANKSGKRKR